jgi:hypothetical protein
VRFVFVFVSFGKLYLCTRCPQAVLPLAVLGEAGGEHQAVLQVDGAGALAPLVRQGLLLHLANRICEVGKSYLLVNKIVFA